MAIFNKKMGKNIASSVQNLLGAASTLTEITDSVKKESKTLVFGSFCMFFAHF